MIQRIGGIAFVGLAVLVVSGSAAASGLEFEARLTGAQEVPAIDTTQVGTLDIEFDSGFTEAEFRLKVFNGVGVTQAHLHCNRAGQNGPVVAFLYGFGPTTDVDGLLSSGTLTNLSFTGADCVPLIGRPINNIAALAFAIRDGLIYVNVHTVAHPPGETRGQLVEDRDDDSSRRDHHSRDDDSDHDATAEDRVTADGNGARPRPERLDRDR